MLAVRLWDQRLSHRAVQLVLTNLPAVFLLPSSLLYTHQTMHFRSHEPRCKNSNYCDYTTLQRAHREAMHGQETSLCQAWQCSKCPSNNRGHVSKGGFVWQQFTPVTIRVSLLIAKTWQGISSVPSELLTYRIWEHNMFYTTNFSIICHTPILTETLPKYCVNCYHTRFFTKQKHLLDVKSCFVYYHLSWQSSGKQSLRYRWGLWGPQTLIMYSMSHGWQMNQDWNPGLSPCKTNEHSLSVTGSSCISTLQKKSWN